jgi:hypothetical protein
VTKLTATWIDHCDFQASGIARYSRASVTMRSVIARIESAFAAFANIPYQDAPTQQEMVCLLQEYKTDYLDETDLGRSDSSNIIDVEGETCVEACPSSRGSAD